MSRFGGFVETVRFENRRLALVVTSAWILGSSVLGECHAQGFELAGPGFPTYLGGTGTDSAWDVAVDEKGAPAIVGFTDSFDLVECPGDERPGGLEMDAFAARFDEKGGVLFCRYFGGTGEDRALGAGFLGDDLIVVGHTASDDFPVTDDALQKEYGGGALDAFLVRLSPESGDIVYATYLGGDGEDSSSSFVVEGDIVTVCGYTESADFHVTKDKNAYQAQNNGASDIFVTRLDLAETGQEQLVYSTYLGGSDHEVTQNVCCTGGLAGGVPDKWSFPDIALSPDGALVIIGSTRSTDFPLSQGALQPNLAGHFDALVVKLDPTLENQLVYSTVIGGAGYDSAEEVAVDPDGTVVIVGITWSEDYPTTPGAFSRFFSEGLHEAFISRIVPDATLPPGEQLLYSTFVGGDGYVLPKGVVVEEPGSVVVFGDTNSTDFPTTPDAFDHDHPRADHVFFRLRLDPESPPTGPDGQLVYSTYVGGDSRDWAGGFASDQNGGVFGCGMSQSSDFPVDEAAVQGGAMGDWDATVIHFRPREASPPFRRGDCNDDGQINLTDAVTNLRHCFSDTAIRCAAACDTDGDGSPCTGVTDGVRILMYLFRGGNALPAPFPGCGTVGGAVDCKTPPAHCP